MTVLLLAFLLPAGAEEAEKGFGETAPDTYTDFLESIPEDIAELLPPELFSSDVAKIGEGVRSMSGFSALLRTAGSIVGLALPECLSTLATVTGLLLTASVCEAFRDALGSKSVGRAFSFCVSLAVFAVLLGKGYESIAEVTGYFSDLNRMTAGILPLMGSLYAAGGNVTAAAASSAGLSLYLAVTEEVVGRTVVPFCGICLAFALIGALDPEIRLSTLLATFKKNYTTLLAFLMTLLIAMLAAQTTLGARADTLAMKSVRFAAGNLIPVVGGSVSELLRTVSAGVGYLRGTIGICALILLLLLLLPTLIRLLLYRLTWQLCASLADLLHCTGEKKLLDEIASLCGYLITAVSICSSVLLLAVSLLIHCASAIGT